MATNIPDFHAPASTGQTLGLDSFLDKVSMVIVFLDLDAEEDRDLLDELDSRHKEFGDERAQLLFVVRRTAREVRELSDDTGWTAPLLADASGSIARDFEVEDEQGGRRPVAVIVDRHGIVLQRIDPVPPLSEEPEIVEMILETVRTTGDETTSMAGR